MIRRFLGFLLTVALAIGCGYFAWQSFQLHTQVAELQVQVAHLKKVAAEHTSTGHKGKGHPASTTSTSDTEDSAAAEGWIALANEHADKAKAAFDRHDYGIAQTEFSQAVEDVRRGTAEPVKATESTVAEVRQKISQLEGGMGDIVNRVKGTVGQ